MSEKENAPAANRGALENNGIVSDDTPRHDAVVSHALAYAAAGWPVFPLQPRSKAPRGGSSGKDDASANEARVREMFAGRADYNIGLRPVPGVIVIDVDPRNGGTLDQLGALPVTWTARTGGGGWHLMFRYQGPTVGRVRGTTGIDIKTTTGYIVVAPSVHPDGGHYEWITEGPVAPLPGHLHWRVRREPPRRSAGRSSTAPHGLVSVVAEATEGNRNNALFWAACRAAEEDASDLVWADLRASAQLAGLNDREIERTLASALGRTGAGR